MYVYFIVSCGTPMYVKIGRAKEPLKRLRDLQVGNGNTLELVAVLKCKSLAHSIEMEHRAHERFGAGYLRGEWFRYNRPMSEQIGKWIRKQTSDLQNGEFTLESLSC